MEEETEMDARLGRIPAPEMVPEKVAKGQGEWKRKVVVLGWLDDGKRWEEKRADRVLGCEKKGRIQGVDNHQG